MSHLSTVPKFSRFFFMASLTPCRACFAAKILFEQVLSFSQYFPGRWLGTAQAGLWSNTEVYVQYIQVHSWELCYAWHRYSPPGVRVWCCWNTELSRKVAKIIHMYGAKMSKVQSAGLVSKKQKNKSDKKLLITKLHVIPIEILTKKCRKCYLIISPDTMQYGLMNIGDTTLVALDIFFTLRNTIRSTQWAST